jgi:DNA-binding winged helix-turn-helix (wHTH) protein/Tfp pilus assembly protein PilF
MGSSHISVSVIRFGVYEADLAAGELRRNGVRVRLQDLPFRALALLLSRPGEVVTRDEFRRTLWPPDVFVDFEQGISSAMMRLRDALRDSAENPVFIETIERRGYRWIGPIHVPDSNPTVQQRDLPAEELPRGPVTPPSPTDPASWRRLVFVLPLLALLFVLWTLRPGFRKASAGTKPPSPTAVSAHAAPSREAEDLYLKGRYYWNKRTPESLNQALEAFTQAIFQDPTYADAYVGLADSYNLMREFSTMPANEAYGNAFSAARKAVELDPQSADAHASLAFATFWGMWDARDADREFRRALELDANNAKVHHWYATFLSTTGRHSQAIAEIETARKLDPHSSSILADKGILLWAAGRHEEAMQLLTQMESTDPDFVSPHRYLAQAYLEYRNFGRYLEELKKEALLTHNSAKIIVADAAAHGFAAGGERGMLEAQLQAQMKLHREGKLSPYSVAETESLLGNKDEALKYLTDCVQVHDEMLINATQSNAFDSLKGDPRFEKLTAVLDVLYSQ